MRTELSHDLPLDAIRRIVAAHGARHVRVFGSRARGDSHAGSDLDLLADFDSGASLLDVIALEQELGDLLGFPVQVITESALSPLLRDRVLSEAIDL